MQPRITTWMHPELTFERVAITEQQIIDHDTPYQASEGHAVAGSGTTSTDTVEAEAMRPDTMRADRGRCL